MKNLLATALNKTLSTDPDSFTRLKKLDHKIVKLTIEPISLTVYLKISSAGFEIIDHGEADITIAGKPSNFIKLSQEKSLYHSGVKVTGDMALADEIKTIFSQLDLDWETLIAEYTGDIPARQITRATTAGIKWAKQANQNFKQDTVEYLQEEVRVLPTRIEMELFTTANSELRDAVARLEARLQAT